jgi:hypothetical protein
MRLSFSLLRTSWLMVAAFASSNVDAAEVDARPPDRLTLSGSGSRLTDTDDKGGGGSLNWLHYFTPNAIFGMGAEHQFVEEAKMTFGSVRGSWARGEPSSRFSIFGEVSYGEGDDDGRDFDYGVAVLALSQNFTSKFSVQLEGRQIEIDTSHGNLPKLSLTYLWTPRLLSSVSYAYSVGGNLGTELTSARIDYYGRHANLMLGGASGRADPAVLVLEPGVVLPASQSKQGFVGIGKTFKRGEVLLLGDYLEVADSEKITVTLSFTAYVGSRGPGQ